jgi:hypothetical protein
MAKKLKVPFKPSPDRTIVVGIRFTVREAERLRRDAAQAGQTFRGRVTSILRKAGAL